ncbi:Assembly chaperone of rpl4-like protein [Elsinoe fawcettii]|nr:Assembly chaperone of rpl4-like protein [Elsinoe fawcettii]
MAKTKTKTKTSGHTRKPSKTAEELYSLALESFEQSNPEEALKHAQNLLRVVDPDFASQKSTSPLPIALPALNLLGEISIETGDEDNARQFFLLAAGLDQDGAMPEEAGGGAEKFMWLAQLSEEGGFDSVRWFEKGVACLKTQIETLSKSAPGQLSKDQIEDLLEEKRERVADALCSVVEIYMTDLSWEEDAEQKCETLITEAMIYAPESPGVLQCLASVRLSQVRVEEAKSALKRSMAVWKDLDPDDEEVPDFAARISLARLLMEAEMEDDAMIVLERLALEDDTSVEACYLGGWCLHLMAEKRQDTLPDGGDTGVNGSNLDDESRSLLQASRKWLTNTINLYSMQQYEDEKLRQHTEELLQKLTEVLGPAESNGAVDEIEEWIDEEDSGDEEMDETT